MSAEKSNFVKSLSTIIASLRNDVDIDLKESVDNVSEFLDINKESLSFILDLIGGNL